MPGVPAGRRKADYISLWPLVESHTFAPPQRPGATLWTLLPGRS